jgi:hypothetical protein
LAPRSITDVTALAVDQGVREHLGLPLNH